MKYPSPWQSMANAPRDRQILVIWKKADIEHIGLCRYNPTYNPADPFWYGYTMRGEASSRWQEYTPIMWTELPPINLENEI